MIGSICGIQIFEPEFFLKFLFQGRDSYLVWANFHLAWSVHFIPSRPYETISVHSVYIFFILFYAYIFLFAFMYESLDIYYILVGLLTYQDVNLVRSDYSLLREWEAPDI